MNPRFLKLINFRGIAEMEIDLSALFLVGIAAPNGSGKSSVFTHAPVYALFGKFVQGSIDDLVRKGQQDMMVEFIFDHNAEVYRIIRTRSLKGKGKSSCDFQKQENNQWVSLNGTTVRETDAKIVELLSLDADVFCASSMIMQNDTSAFSRKQPANRKQVLTSILNLDLYDSLQSQAKDRAKTVEIKLEASKQTLERLAEELEQSAEVELQLAEIKKQIALTATDIAQKETELAGVQAEIKRLEDKQRESEQIGKQVELLDNQINEAISEISALDRKIGQAEIILESESEIVQKLHELEEVKAEIPLVTAKQTRLVEMQDEAKTLERQNELAKNQHTDLQHQILALQLDLDKRDELAKQVEMFEFVKTDLSMMEELALRDDQLLKQVMALEKATDSMGDEIRNHEMQIKIYTSKLADVQNKTEILQNSGCPNPENATCKFLMDALQSQQTIPRIEQDIQQAKDSIDAIQTKRIPLIEQVKTLEISRDNLHYNAERHYKLKQQIETLRKSKEEFDSLAGKEELRQVLLKQANEKFAETNEMNKQIYLLKEKFYQMEEEISVLPYLKKQFIELSGYAEMQAKIPEARASKQQAEERLAQLKQLVFGKDKERIELNSRIDALQYGFSLTLSYQKGKASDHERDIKQCQANLNNLYSKQGFYQQSSDDITKAKTKHDTLKAELAPTAKELTRWQTLVKAFGKSGIPALIIENSIPELERIANSILSQMTNGMNSLRFDTQRDKKDGKGVIETLDIWASDSTGYERIYETFSGGEQTRIDLAIRFALSELLASRAGSKIEWIVADEVLSDQSPEFREMTVEAIKAVSNRFKKILLISHIPEIQSAFEQQIVLSEGGQAEIIFN